VIAETEAVRAKEMNMDVAWATVQLKLEMMVFNVSQAVTHFRFPGVKGLGPEHLPVPFDGRGHGSRFELCIHHEFWPKGTVPEFRAREV